MVSVEDWLSCALAASGSGHAAWGGRRKVGSSEGMRWKNWAGTGGLWLEARKRRFVANGALPRQA